MEQRHCSKCGEPKPLDQFQKFKGRPSGQCRGCRSAGMARLRRERGVPKRRVGRGPRKAPDPEKIRIATASYRARHPERWRAAHRIHQAKRRDQIQVTDDGTLDDAALKEIYGTEDCFYCKNFTPPKQRTLEHKTPLVRGGHHSKSNACMACSDCNNKKGSMTSSEFMERL